MPLMLRNNNVTITYRSYFDVIITLLLFNEIQVSPAICFSDKLSQCSLS